MRLTSPVIITDVEVRLPDRGAMQGVTGGIRPVIPFSADSTEYVGLELRE